MQPAPDAKLCGADLHLTFTASPDLIRDQLARALTLAPLSGLTDDGRGAAELVLAEVLNNVAEHAYREHSGQVSLTIGRRTPGIHILVVDKGKPMPGGQPPDGLLPDRFATTLDNLPEGGFGWYLIRSLTTDLIYTRINGCNQLRFILPLD